MADPVVIVILVAAADLGSPTTAAMERATRDALGERAVEVQRVPGAGLDTDLLGVQRASHSPVVVELTWADPARRHATLRAHVAPSDRWIERSVSFVSTDPPAERGRALGFAIAALAPESTGAPTVAPRATPSPTERTAPTPAGPAATPTGGTAPAGTAPAGPEATPTGAAPAGTAPVGAAPAGTASGKPAPSNPTPREAPPGPTPAPLASPSGESPDEGVVRPTAPPEPVHLAVDVQAIAAFGRDARGYGASLAVEWFPVELLALRAGGGVTMGQIDAAEASTSTARVSAGIALHPWRATPAHPFGGSVRVDYLVAHDNASHYDTDDPNPVTAGRWLSGFDAVLGGSWLFASSVEVIAGLGLEDVFGTTYLSVRGARVATLPPLRAIAEGGLRLRF